MAVNDQEILSIVDRAVDEFNGDLDDLESAIGMLLLGRHYGWRVVLLIHSPTTVRKYLKILGLKNLRDVLPGRRARAPFERLAPARRHQELLEGRARPDQRRAFRAGREDPDQALLNPSIRLDPGRAGGAAARACVAFPQHESSSPEDYLPLAFRADAFRFYPLDLDRMARIAPN